MERRKTKTFSKLKNYIMLERIGFGNFSEVWKGIEISTKNFCAIKIIDKAQTENHPKVLELLESEIRILKAINNENVVRLYDSFFEQGHHYLILEYCDGGDLENYVKSKPSRCISEAEALDFFKQMLNGFKALHQEKAMHRDFKLANVLLHQGVLKIADLGFSRQAEVASTALGTAVYMAPEILKFQKYNNKVDMWALGVCLYEMIMGKVPFTAWTEKDLLRKIMLNTIDFSGKEVSPELQDLIKNMLIPDPNKRMNWIDVYEHKILNNKAEQEENKHKPQSRQDLDKAAQSQNFEKNKSFYADGSNLDYDNEALKAIVQKILKKEEIQESGDNSGSEGEEEKKEEEIKKKIESELMEKQKSLMLLENKYLHKKNIISFHAKVLYDGFRLIKNMNGIYIYFVFSKRLLWLAKHFQEALQQKQNIFEDQNFEGFTKSREYEKIASVFNGEILIYEFYFDSLLADIMAYETNKSELYATLRGEFEKDWKNVDDMLFKQILVEYCLSGGVWIENYCNDKKPDLANKFAHHLIELIDCFNYKDSFQFNLQDEAGFDFDHYIKGIMDKGLDAKMELLNVKTTNLF